MCGFMPHILGSALAERGPGLDGRTTGMIDRIGVLRERSTLRLLREGPEHVELVDWSQDLLLSHVRCHLAWRTRHCNINVIVSSQL